MGYVWVGWHSLPTVLGSPPLTRSLHRETRKSPSLPPRPTFRSFPTTVRCNGSCAETLVSRSVSLTLGQQLAVNPAPNSPLRQLHGSDSEIRPYLIRTFANGERLGICGLTTKVITEQASNPDPGTTLDDEAQAAATCVSELDGMGIDKIVLLAHTGFASDVDNYASIPGVDVVVGGHSHSLLGGPELEIQGLSPVGTYAGMTESGVCIVHGWEFAKLVGELKVAFDDAGNVVSCTGGPRFPLNPDRMDLNDAAEDAEDKELGEADRAIVVANLTSYPHWVLATPDADVEAVLKPYNDDIQSLLLSPIAPVPENICHTRRGDGIDEQCPNKPEISLLNGGVCPLVAQSFLYNALTADFALQNAGGCRTDILSGELTLGEAYELLPFSNNLVTLRLTGEQIVRSLEDGLSFYMDVKAGSGSFPNTAGLRYDIDLTAEKGSRVSNIEMNPRLEGEWEPLDLERSFVVVTTDFLATPRDGYDTLGEVDKGDEDQFVSLYIAYAQSLINYMSALGIVEEVAPDTYPL